MDRTRRWGVCEEHGGTPGFQIEIWEWWKVPCVLLFRQSRCRESMRKAAEMWLEREGRSIQAGLVSRAWTRSRWQKQALKCNQEHSSTTLWKQGWEGETRMGACGWARLKSRCFILSWSQDKQESFRGIQDCDIHPYFVASLCSCVKIIERTMLDFSSTSNKMWYVT